MHKVPRLFGASWRRLRAFCATFWHRVTLAQVGRNCRFQGNVRFADPRIVRMGCGCYLANGVSASADYPGSLLQIGDDVQINRDVHLDTTGGLSIGDRTLISESVAIYTHDHGLDPRSAPVGRPKLIDPDVWIGMRAVILPGCVRIGKGAVIGAGAIVTHDVPMGAIMAGNPARIIGQVP